MDRRAFLSTGSIAAAAGVGLFQAPSIAQATVTPTHESLFVSAAASNAIAVGNHLHGRSDGGDWAVVHNTKAAMLTFWEKNRIDPLIKKALWNLRVSDVGTKGLDYPTLPKFHQHFHPAMAMDDLKRLTSYLGTTSDQNKEEVLEALQQFGYAPFLALGMKTAAHHATMLGSPVTFQSHERRHEQAHLLLAGCRGFNMATAGVGVAAAVIALMLLPEGLLVGAAWGTVSLVMRTTGGLMTLASGIGCGF